jgi:PKD repeat protein
MKELILILSIVFLSSIKDNKKEKMGGNLPKAQFTVVVDGLTVILDNTSTTSSDKITYHWDYGDNRGVSTLKSPPAYTYVVAGNYTITLTVSSAAGSDVTTQPVTISVALRSITFDATGGLPAPSTQLTRNGGKIAEPETPVKTDFMFAGWYSETGERIDFKTFTVNSDMTLHAKWWKGPEQFIFINGIDLEFFYDKIHAMFGDQTGKRVAVGQAFILYCFERRREVMLKNLNKHLSQSRQYNLPVLIQLDAITFMDARPDLWNWWDSSKASYNPANRENVEWTSWSSDDAVKLGWLNWGRQMRITPMPNLMSPAYRNAVAEQMSEFTRIVLDWYEDLPADQKWLFAGIKVTGEVSFGVNNWYYPNGNGYLDKDPANDPQTGIYIYDFPGRRAQPIGYAALKTGGIKSSGQITEDDIALLAKRHTEIVSKLCADFNIPRSKIFAHAFGAEKDLEACVNSYACPCWSFYDNHPLRGGGLSHNATHPKVFSAALNILKTSDAPYFGIAEWRFFGDDAASDASRWSLPIIEGLSIPRCRFLSIYANVVGSDIFNRVPNPIAIAGIKAVQETAEKP